MWTDEALNARYTEVPRVSFISMKERLVIWTVNSFPALIFSLTMDSWSVISVICPLKTFLALDFIGLLERIMSSGRM